MFLKLLRSKQKYYSRGIAYYNQKRFQEAISCFTKILAAHERTDVVHYNLAKFYSAQANKNLGLICFAGKNLEDAANYFRTALELNPRHFDLYFLLGICYNALGQYSLALESFQTLLEIAPEVEVPIQIKIALTMQRLHLWDKSEAIFKAILAKKPHYADVNFYLALTMIGKEQFDLAIKYLERALQINPSYVEARIKKAQVLWRINKTEEAYQKLQSILDNHPDYADVQFLSGLILQELGDTRSAIMAFQKALKINPNFVQARVSLGVLYCLISKSEDGLKQFSLALKTSPGDKTLQNLITTLQGPLQNQQDFHKYMHELSYHAEPRQSRFLFDQKSFQSQSFSELISLANLSHVLKLDIALSEFLLPYLQEALQEHPSYADLYNSLGILYFNLKQYQLAKESFEQALTINPNYIQAMVNLLKTLFKLKSLDKARAVGEELISLGIKYADVLYLQAEIYVQQGKLTDARKLLKEIVSKDDKFVRAKMLLAKLS